MLMCCTGAAAQNGVYTVVNREALASEKAARTMIGNSASITTEQEGTEHDGRAPEEIDTAELREVLALWMMDNLSGSEMETIAGEVPGGVTIDDKAITLTDTHGDTLMVYAVERREYKKEGAKWLMVCGGGRQVWLQERAGEEWRLTLPDRTALKLRKRD